MHTNISIKGSFGETGFWPHGHRARKAYSIRKGRYFSSGGGQTTTLRHRTCSNRFRGVGSDKYFATQENTKHVLGQHRFLGVGPDKYCVTQKKIKACPWSKPLPWGGVGHTSCDTGSVQRMSLVKTAPVRKSHGNMSRQCGSGLCRCGFARHGFIHHWALPMNQCAFGLGLRMLGCHRERAVAPSGC